MTRRARAALRVGPAVALAALAALALPAAVAAQPNPAVSLSNGRLNVRVREAPLEHVLQLIVARSGIGIAAAGNLDAPITASFDGVEPEEAIRRLAGRHATVWVAVPAQLVAGPGGAVIVGPRALPPLRQPVDAARLDGASRSLRDADPRVRVRGVLALGRLRSPEAAAALQTALADPVASVRLQAAYAVRRSQGPAAIPALSQLSAGDPDPQVRLAAVRALASLRGPGVVSALEWAGRDTEASIRREAERALARIVPRP